VERSKAWYKHADGKGSKPSCDCLDKLEAEYTSLYRRGNPLGDPVPVLVAPFDVDDGVPMEGEIADTVQRMRNGKAPGPSGLRVEHLKEWLVLSERKQDLDGSKWEKLYELIQHVFLSGDLPRELSWSVLVLVPKGIGGFRGIGLLEVASKVVAAIIDARLKAEIQFHDSLHGFRAARYTVTATIEAKLLMHNACAQRKALYQIFIDLEKAYDTLDRGRTLEVLKGYGTGPRVLRFLETFWDNQDVVARQGGYHSKAFKAERRVTQEDIPSPMIFNIVVDCVIWAWELEISDGRSLTDEVVRSLVAAMLYDDDGLIASYQLKLAQDSLDYLVEIFQRMVLNINTSKTKFLTCSPRSAKGHISIQAYKRRMDGDGPTHRDRQRRRSECPVCQKGISAGYLHVHLRQVHGRRAPSMESPENLTSIGNPASCF
jgi:hypothetical protein